MSDAKNYVESEDDDRRTFGPSASNREVLDLLVKQAHFRTAIGAFQAAAMLAIREGLDPDQAPPSTGTMWNRGTINFQILEFLSWYIPTTAPVRLFAQLGNAGTEYIGSKVRTGGYTLSEIFELPKRDDD